MNAAAVPAAAGHGHDGRPGRHGASSRRIADGVTVAFAIGVGILLKLYYRRASAEDLRWVLAPTVRLVEWITGADFAFEAHRGFVSRDHLFEVAPACAGINFMVVVWCTLSCGLLRACSTLRDRLALLSISAAAAYAVAVTANAVRIAISSRPSMVGAAWGPLGPEHVHVAIGVAVFFLFECVAFAVASRWAERRHA